MEFWRRIRADLNALVRAAESAPRTNVEFVGGRPFSPPQPSKPTQKHDHGHIALTPLWHCCASPAHARPPQQLPAPQTTPAGPSRRVTAAAHASWRVRASAEPASASHARSTQLGHDDADRPVPPTRTTRQRRAAAPGYVPLLSSRHGRRAHLRASERPHSRRLRRTTRT